jgi:hypothetical protein
VRAARAGAHRSAQHIDLTDRKPIDVQVPREQRQGRPAQRDVRGAQPGALGVAQLHRDDLDVVGEAAAEARDAHTSRGEL